MKAVVLLMLLSACHWQPVYYQNKQTVESAYVEVLPLAEKNGRLLTQKLKDLMNPQALEKEKKYTLTVSLNETLDDDQGILGDNTATRSTMQIKASFQLKDKLTQKVILSSSAFATSSYNILMLPYSTKTAEDATRQRLLENLAGQIATHISVYFRNEEVKHEVQ